MRVPQTPEIDEPPPPPYTHQAPVSQKTTALQIPTSLRRGYISHAPRSQASDVSNLSAAATYFEDRPVAGRPALQNAGADVAYIEHTIPFIPGAGREQIVFPQPAESFFERDVSYEDWATFRNFLFPPNADVSKSEKINRGTNEDPRDISKQDTPEHRGRLAAVIAEWNQGFFSPRGIRILADFEPIPNLTRSGGSPVPQRLSHEAPIPNGQSGIPNSAREAPYIGPVPSHRSPRHGRRRTLSSSSTGSSTSFSSDTSVSSIKSKDLEGCTPNSMQSALTTFRTNAANGNHIRHAVSQLLEAFRTEIKAVSPAERKNMKKQYKNEYKHARKEIKSLMKDAKKSRKAQRKALRHERHVRRDGERAERRNFRKGNKLCPYAERRLARGEARSPEAYYNSVQVPYEYTPGIRAQTRETGQGATEREAEIAAYAPTAATITNHGASGESWGDIGREKARSAESRAADKARQGKKRGKEAEERALRAADDAISRDWGATGRERAREAEQRASVAAGGAANRDWGAYGRERAREAEARAAQAAYGPR